MLVNQIAQVIAEGHFLPEQFVDILAVGEYQAVFSQLIQVMRIAQDFQQALVSLQHHPDIAIQLGGNVFPLNMAVGGNYCIRVYFLDALHGVYKVPHTGTVAAVPGACCYQVDVTAEQDALFSI